jgi:hypothetical protein
MALNDHTFELQCISNLDFTLSPLFVHYFNFSARRGDVAPPSTVFQIRFRTSGYNSIAPRITKNSHYK